MIGLGRELLRAAVDWGGFDKITIWSATLSESAKATLQSNRFNLWNEVKYFASIPTVLVKRHPRSNQECRMDSERHAPARHRELGSSHGLF